MKISKNHNIIDSDTLLQVNTVMLLVRLLSIVDTSSFPILMISRVWLFIQWLIIYAPSAQLIRIAQCILDWRIS